MKAITFSESLAKYAETLDAVVNDREPVIVTREGHEPVVIISLEDYQNLEKTASLLKDPANSVKLLNSIVTSKPTTPKSMRTQDELTLKGTTETSQG